MKIIDTHIHIWNFEKARYPWLKGDTTILNRTYNISELEEDRIEAGISSGILVQAANNSEDTDWMLHIASEQRWLAGVVGWLPLSDPEATEQILQEKYLQNPLFRGVRHLIHNEPDPKWLLQDNVIESLLILSKHNIPYDIVGIIPEHIETSLKVAAKVPGLRMVFDHLNQPPILQKEKYGKWGELMKEAAEHPNFYVKISGLGTASQNLLSWNGDDIKPYVAYTLQTFSVDRCFCGGDWPVSLLAGTYRKTWKVYIDVLQDLVDDISLEKILSGNAEKFYGIG